MSSLARLLEAIELLAALIISSAVIETFLPLPHLLKSLFNNISLCSSDKAGRRVLFKEKKHGSGKDITEGFQFWESSLHNPFDLIFSRSDKMGDRLSFSGDIPEVFGVLRDRELLYGILVKKDELSDSKGIFFISLGFTQSELGEIGDEKWINNNGIDPFVGQEREEIDMVAACRFHASHDIGKIFTMGSNSLHQLGKTAFIHGKRHGKPYIAFSIKTCSGERILGYIDTNEEFRHNSTSVKTYSDKAGETSRPILHDDKDSMIQSTYYGYGRQGTDSFKGSSTQMIWSSPACPTLTGKTRLYKFYNTNF